MNDLLTDSVVDDLLETNEDYAWLELDKIPDYVTSELDYIYDTPGADPVVETVKLMMQSENLAFAAYHLLGVTMPPIQMVALDVLWQKKLPILVATRGFSKTFLLAVYSFLRMIFNPGSKVIVISASFRQSKQVFEYMVDIYNKSPLLQDIVGASKDKRNGPKQGLDRCEFRIDRSVTIAIPIGSGEKIRGLRGNYILSDEFASISEQIFNIVVQGFGSVSSDPIEKVKAAATKNRLQTIGAWTPEMDEIMSSSFVGNQIVMSGTGYFEFNHFAKKYKKWREIIACKSDMNKIKAILGEDQSLIKAFNPNDYAILQVPYTALPEGFLDPGIIAQAKATLSSGQFMMEYGARFSKDTNGFFKRSTIESATCHTPIRLENGDKVQFVALKEGKYDRRYMIGIDPAAHADNAAIVVLEVHPNHRRVVYCWSVNKDKFDKLKKKGYIKEDDYYRYICRKIRSLMSVFNTSDIVIDREGGGSAIIESLGSIANCQPGELPIFPVIDREAKDPAPTDFLNGLHMVTLVKANNEYNATANHGMLKDMEDKKLLFPLFDTVEMEKQLLAESQENIDNDTYEDVVMEIEELKAEMTTIVCTPSPSLGLETFDTPKVKTELVGGEMKKGRLRKDRYSALLMVNMHARQLDAAKMSPIKYEPIGIMRNATNKFSGRQVGQLYTGPTIDKVKSRGEYKGFGGLWVKH